MFSLLLEPPARIYCAPLKSPQAPLPIEKMSPNERPPDLAELRAEIDRIDEAMHRLPIEGGQIIGRLIEGHAGRRRLDTAESIWRVIIATFTYVQAPFRVHADFSCGESAMRDSERFHFGFTVPVVAHLGAAGVVAAVAAAKGDLGL